MTSPTDEVKYPPSKDSFHSNHHTDHSASTSSSDRYSSAATLNHIRPPDIDLSERERARDGADSMEDEDDRRNKDVQIAASEAARRRHFKALRTAKACDVCKIRKVKCDGGEPCAACRAHSSACVYSQTTRTRLLSLSAAAGGGSHSNSSASPTSRQPSNRHDSERPTYSPSDPHFGGRLGLYERQPNMYSDSSNANAYASSSSGRYSTADQRRPLSSPAYGGYSYPYAANGPYTESRLPESADRGGESRSPFENRAWPNSAPSWHGDAPRRTLPAISDLHSANRWTGHETNHHGPIHLPPLNNGAPSPSNHASHSGSGYSDARDLPRPATERTASPNERPAVREDGFVEHQGISDTYNNSRDTMRAEPASKRPRFNDGNAVEQSDTTSSLRGKLVPRVRRGPENLLGMSGVTTTFPDGLDGMRWWGPSSFLAFHVRLMQLIQYHKDASPDEEGRLAESVKLGKTTISPEVSKALWLWGADDIILDNPVSAFAKSPQLDIMFLPNGFAERFLQSFCIAVHPLYPFYDLAKIRQSIQSRFAGGVTYNADRLEFAYSTVEQKLDHARDLLVLAMGARIEGGNGDAHLPKPVAETWATLLSKRSKVLLSDLGSSGGSNDIIKLWILHSLYSSMTGDIEQEYIAVGHASSIALALGLNHSCILTLADAEDATVRTTFHTVYFLERSISLRLGRPNRMAAVKDEIDPVILPPESPDHKIAHLRANADLGVISEAVYSLYHHQSATETQEKAHDSIWKVNRMLDGFRLRLPEPLASFDEIEDEGPISLDSEIGEMAVVKFDLAIHFYSLKILVCFSTLCRDAHHQITGGSPNRPPSVDSDDAAVVCIRAASTLVRLFDEYFAKLPYLPFVGHFAFCFLYVAPVLYVAVLRDLKRPAAKAVHFETARVAMRVLEKLDHVAARVSYNIIQDVLADFSGDVCDAKPADTAWSAPSLTHLDRMPSTERR